MKYLKITLPTIVLILSMHHAKGQCIAKAADLDAYCKHQYDTMSLGGQPTATGGIPPYSYAWSILDGSGSIYEAIDDPNSSNPLAYFTKSFLLLLTVTDSNKNQCYDTVRIARSDETRHNMFNKDRLKRGDSIRLNTAIGIETLGNPPYKHFWSPSTGLSDSTEIRTWAKPLDTIQYILTITNKLGCQFYDQYTIDVYGEHTSINTVIQKNDWTIQHRKNSKSIIINPPKEFKNSFEITIIDRKGIELISEKLAFGKMEIDLNNLESGVYFVLIRGLENSMISYKKFVIEN